MNKILIEQSTNGVSEAEENINARLDALGDKWRIVSAITTAETCSIWETDAVFQHAILPRGYPKHVVYVATVIIEKTVRAPS